MSEQVSPTTSSLSQDENQNKETPVSKLTEIAKMIKKDAREKKTFHFGIYSTNINLPRDLLCCLSFELFMQL